VTELTKTCYRACSPDSVVVDALTELVPEELPELVEPVEPAALAAPTIRQTISTPMRAIKIFIITPFFLYNRNIRNRG
jgi:hypothetical protein